MSFSVRIFEDIEDCRALWEKFSPKKSLFDEWEYSYAFYLEFPFRLHFVEVLDGKMSIGLFPLWYQSELRTYLWFGDIGDLVNDICWREDITFWFRDRRYVPEALRLLPRPIRLNNLAETVDCEEFVF